MQETVEQAPIVNHCPECAEPIDVSALAPYAKIECPHCGAFVRVRTTMGQYQIVGLLGEGGMSQVFRAVDRNLGREAALKVLHQSLSRDSALTSMFEREAQLTASIVHPNVVKVFTVGKDNGYFFIAMELVHAISLEEIIANKGALSESEVLAIAEDVTRGLMAAFSEDLIHRDIKPGNMLVTGEGTTKLVDFGLAVQQGGVDEAEELWATPFYVPPEKLDGHPDTFLGDLYSLGATLYHALAGKPPFEANTASLEELIEIKKSAVDLKSSAPGLSKATIKLVERMMAHDPSERFQSYEETLSQIEEIRKRQFGVEPMGRVVRGRRKVRFAWVAGAGSALAVALAVVVLVNRGPTTDDGELGIGPRERVIGAGEDTLTGKFLGGRELFASGDFRKAERIFDEVVVEDSAPASIRMWSHFFGGLTRLAAGRETEARESFARVVEITPESEENGVEALVFLRRASPALADSLPLLSEDAAFSSDSIEALGLFAVGLKNWQHGEFASGIAFLTAFSESEPPPEFEWIGRLKEQVGPFLRDFEDLDQLPNPIATDSEETLSRKEAALNASTSIFRTKGAVPALVKGRIDRIAAIRELAAAAPKPEPVAESAPMPEEEQSPAAAGPRDVDRLRALVERLVPIAVDLQFSDAVATIEGERFGPAPSNVLRNELVRAYLEAGDFVGELVRAFNETRYEGVVRRREGRPLEAAITSASPSAFIVDLGFGPNEVEVEAFAVDWLVEAAKEVFPPVSEGSAASWEKLVFFAFVTGNGDLVRASADQLAATNPEFARRWQQLRVLR